MQIASILLHSLWSLWWKIICSENILKNQFWKKFLYTYIQIIFFNAYLKAWYNTYTMLYAYLSWQGKIHFQKSTVTKAYKRNVFSLFLVGRPFVVEMGLLSKWQWLNEHICTSTYATKEVQISEHWHIWTVVLHNILLFCTFLPIENNGKQEPCVRVEGTLLPITFLWSGKCMNRVCIIIGVFQWSLKGQFTQKQIRQYFHLSGVLSIHPDS